MTDTTNKPARPDTSAARTNVPQLIAEMEGGTFDYMLSVALSQVAAAVTTHEKKGRVVVEFDFEHIKGTAQVRLAHKLKYARPTSAGKSTEESEGATVLYVGRFGELTLAQPSLLDPMKQDRLPNT